MSRVEIAVLSGDEAPAPVRSARILQEVITGFVEITRLAVGQVAKNALARHAENQKFDFSVTTILQHQAVAAG